MRSAFSPDRHVCRSCRLIEDRFGSVSTNRKVCDRTLQDAARCTKDRSVEAAAQYQIATAGGTSCYVRKFIRLAAICLNVAEGLGADLQRCSAKGLGQLGLLDAHGPHLPFVSWSSAAVQLHQTGHSSIVQHSRGVEVGSADIVAVRSTERS